MTFNEYQNQFHKENTTLTSGFTFVTLRGKLMVLILNLV